MDWEIGLVGCLGFGAMGLALLQLLQRRSAVVDQVPNSSDALKTSQFQQLEQQLQTLTASLQASQTDVADLTAQNTALYQECLQLRQQLASQAFHVQAESQMAAFKIVQALLTQYPSMRRMIEIKPDLPARNLVAMLAGLDNLIGHWGLITIGAPWQSVAFDPQLHQGDTADLQPEETVYIRFVGYRQADRILVPAKVSRTLPAGAVG